jgi:chaperone modulatory protein CbpM
MTITLDTLATQLIGLQRHDLERWIDNDWVRPDGPDGQYVFHDIDVERVRLILVLRNEMQVNEDALPVVLSLLDQLYELRRRLNALNEQRLTA